MMNKYRKKPIIIEAEQFTEEKYLENPLLFPAVYTKNFTYYIETLEGDLQVLEGDYIVKGIKGEFYPVKEQIFLESYEKVEEGDKND